MYSKKDNLIIGFHGCKRSIFEYVRIQKIEIIPSSNDYDWVGSLLYMIPVICISDR